MVSASPAPSFQREFSRHTFGYTSPGNAFDDDQRRSVSIPILEKCCTHSPPTDRYLKVHMFSNAQNISMQDTAIHNSGRDITIINNYIYTEPQPVRARLSYVASSDDLGGLS